MTKVWSIEKQIEHGLYYAALARSTAMQEAFIEGFMESRLERGPEVLRKRFAGIDASIAERQAQGEDVANSIAERNALFAEYLAQFEEESKKEAIEASREHYRKVIEAEKAGKVAPWQKQDWNDDSV